MFKARQILVYLPEDQVDEHSEVEFQSNPEIGLLAIFPDEGSQCVIYSGMSFKVTMEGEAARESYEMANKAQTLSMNQMKQMFAREQGTPDDFSSSFG